MKMKSILKELLKEKDSAQMSYVKLKEASGLGADFDRAQRAYDARMPEEPDELECPNCGEESGYYTNKYKKGGYYSWEAKCPKCGHVWGDDNFPE